jgi:hypothetical protein
MASQRPASEKEPGAFINEVESILGGVGRAPQAEPVKRLGIEQWLISGDSCPRRHALDFAGRVGWSYVTWSCNLSEAFGEMTSKAGWEI